MSAQRFVPGRGFAMVPAWLALKKPSGNALILYVHVAMWGRFNQGSARYEDCQVSKQELSTGVPDSGYEGTGLSVATISRCLRELLGLGAIVGKPQFADDGSQIATKFEVIFGELAEPQRTPHVARDTPPHVTGDGPRGVTRDTPPMSRVTPLIKEEEEVLRREEQPPPATTSALPPDVPLSSPDQEEGEGSSETTDHGPAMRVLTAACAAAGARYPIPPSRAATLAGLLTPRLAAGWTEPAVLAALSDPLVGTQSAYAIMKWRITNLLGGPPPKQLPPRPPVQRRPRCGTCGGGGKVPTEPEAREFAGVVRRMPHYTPCPDCADGEAAA